MALMSMTGFGRGEASVGGMKIEAELGSVNRKQFDVRVTLPRPLAVLEPRVHELVHRAISRGHVTVTLRVIVSGSVRRQGIVIDMDTARAYVARLRRAAASLKLADDLNVSTLFQFPDVVRCETVEEDPEKLWPVMRRALAHAVENLIEMRRREGESLQRDLRRRFHGLRRRMTLIRKTAPRMAQNYRAALIRRIREAGADIETDERLLLREVAIVADRLDISEELVRLESHFQQADTLMAGEAPAGRALDFLCQEFFRELNTIGSKANDAAVSGRVVELKAALETIREQVQNVE